MARDRPPTPWRRPTFEQRTRWQDPCALPTSLPPRLVIGGAGPSGSRRSLRVTPLGVSDIGGDDIDPLEAGPDPQLPQFDVDAKATNAEDEDEDDDDDVDEHDEHDGADSGVDAEGGGEARSSKRGRARPARRAVQEDRSDAASMSGLASMVSATRGSGSKRRRRDPLMPRGAPDPVDWTQLGDMKEGARAHLVRMSIAACRPTIESARLALSLPHRLYVDGYGAPRQACHGKLSSRVRSPGRWQLPACSAVRSRLTSWRLAQKAQPNTLGSVRPIEPPESRHFGAPGSGLLVSKARGFKRSTFWTSCRLDATCHFREPLATEKGDLGRRSGGLGVGGEGRRRPLPPGHDPRRLCGVGSSRLLASS